MNSSQAQSSSSSLAVDSNKSVENGGNYENEAKITTTLQSQYWPEIIQGQKIPTQHFLLGCETVVAVSGAMGTVLTPVKKDMEGNVNKLKKTLGKNPAQYKYLEDLICIENGIRGSNSVDALLWLKRALTFIYVLLDKVVSDVDKGINDQDITCHYSDSYNSTLRRYHNWVIQNSFIACIKCGLLPGRRVILMAMPTSRDAPPETTNEDLANKLKPFLSGLRENLSAVINFYHTQGLDTVASL